MSIPDFSCNPETISNWNTTLAGNYVTKNHLRLCSVPYPKLILMQREADQLPTEHYSELISFVKQINIDGAIYIKSAPIYVILILAASTSANVSIVLAHDYPDRQTVQTAFVLNNIRDKVILEEQSDTSDNL